MSAKLTEIEELIEAIRQDGFSKGYTPYEKIIEVLQVLINKHDQLTLEVRILQQALSDQISREADEKIRKRDYY